MKKFIAMLALLMVVCTASAQGEVHDYARLEYFGILRQLVIVSTCDEQRTIDLKEKSGKDRMVDYEQTMKEVARLESLGWVLFDYAESSHDGNQVWILRKPKQ